MKREASVETMRRLCEAADSWFSGDPIRRGRPIDDAIAAYRAETAPLRTRAVVDAEIARAVRSVFADLHPDTMPDWMRGTIEALRRLCLEPTAPDDGPSGKEPSGG
jgi:hypothetical protein